jgi:hypothetical protein
MSNLPCKAARNMADFEVHSIPVSCRFEARAPPIQRNPRSDKEHFELNLPTPSTFALPEVLPLLCKPLQRQICHSFPETPPTIGRSCLPMIQITLATSGGADESAVNWVLPCKAHLLCKRASTCHTTDLGIATSSYTARLLPLLAHGHYC